MTAGSQDQPSGASLKGPGLVLVEGSDDRALVRSILKSRGISNIQTYLMNGKSAWPTKLRALRREASFRNVKALALIRDADADPGSAAQSCKDTMRVNEISYPESPASVQIVDDFASGFFILPHDAPGAMEEACLAGLDPTVLACVEEFLQCATVIDSLSQPGKNRAHSFLAALDPPAPSLGVAVEMGAVDLTVGSLALLSEFLGELSRTAES